MPWIVALIATFAQMRVIPLAPRLDQRPVRADRPHAVVALEHIEAAFRHPRPDDAVGLQPQSPHPFGIGVHMGLADQPARHARFAQMVAHRPFADLERRAVPAGAMAVHIPAGIGRHPRWPAYRRLHIGAGEPDAHCGQPVHVRRLQVRVSVAAQIVPAKLVEHDEQDVPGFHQGSPSTAAPKLPGGQFRTPVIAIAFEQLPEQ